MVRDGASVPLGRAAVVRDELKLRVGQTVFFGDPQLLLAIGPDVPLPWLLLVLRVGRGHCDGGGLVSRCELCLVYLGKRFRFAGQKINTYLYNLIQYLYTWLLAEEKI